MHGGIYRMYSSPYETTEETSDGEEPQIVTVDENKQKWSQMSFKLAVNSSAYTFIMSVKTRCIGDSKVLVHCVCQTSFNRVFSLWRHARSACPLIQATFAKILDTSEDYVSEACKISFVGSEKLATVTIPAKITTVTTPTTLATVTTPATLTTSTTPPVTLSAPVNRAARANLASLAAEEGTFISSKKLDTLIEYMEKQNKYMENQNKYMEEQKKSTSEIKNLLKAIVDLQKGSDGNIVYINLFFFLLFSFLLMITLIKTDYIDIKKRVNVGSVERAAIRAERTNIYSYLDKGQTAQKVIGKLSDEISFSTRDRFQLRDKIEKFSDQRTGENQGLQRQLIRLKEDMDYLYEHLKIDQPSNKRIRTKYEPETPDISFENDQE
ncbi:hypothetical protein BCR41DRAFT_59950 [Lobosporangium transversale]|uniref:Uncharacterized protein n=1 Tax=Lobosporangium transversale TaxID=64571 RepID=A0A1Y2GMZ3_9FUNG|nr:hypothetical protein BCR41DRAFT_59950 [Lobosporangium transversale]ORZ16077.1 hypothetical protein BCR41DRAFT_59950 [Lobosporangium transversale]|eukprot:XP_021881424.1 hypothetical protein BCR41DRAFT_59950 [Lobosporangium transversale]